MKSIWQLNKLISNFRLVFKHKFVVFTLENVSINNYTLINLKQQLIKIKFLLILFNY